MPTDNELPGTFKESWDRYIKISYDHGITKSQGDQLHQAFYAGALVAIGMTTKLSDLAEDEAVLAFDKLFNEITDECKKRIAKTESHRANN
jgi:hypothetical protein